MLLWKTFSEEIKKNTLHFLRYCWCAKIQHWTRNFWWQGKTKDLEWRKFPNKPTELQPELELSQNKFSNYNQVSQFKKWGGKDLAKKISGGGKVAFTSQFSKNSEKMATLFPEFTRLFFNPVLWRPRTQLTNKIKNFHCRTILNHADPHSQVKIHPRAHLRNETFSAHLKAGNIQN